MNNREVNDLSKIHLLLDGVDPPPEEPDIKLLQKTEIVTVMAFLLALREDLFSRFFEAENPELAARLREDPAANIVRDLCTLRIQLYKKFKQTDQELLNNLNNLDRQEWFDQEAIRRLRENGVEVIQANFRAEDYSLFFSRLITEYIEKCRQFFPEWLKFSYITEAFCAPNYTKNGVLKSEFHKYHENWDFYPYHLYLYWNPMDIGNLLINDEKFVKTIYTQHGDQFWDSSKFHDAADSTKQSIYECIDRSDQTVIVVDCENSDAFKLLGVLRNLNSSEIRKIKRIVLFDDYHTTNAWTWLKNFTDIPVEYREAERITGRKSLVDIKMTAGICEAYYQDYVDTFIICSSDSDFWGVISSLPKANFLVMYEYSKVGQAIKDALDTRGFFHCALDDFFTGNATDFQKAVLLIELRKRAPFILGKTAMEITREVYLATRITAKESEMNHFCDKYVRTMRLRTDSEGKYFIDVTEG